MHTLVLLDIDGTLFFGHGCSREAARLAMLEVFGVAGDVANHSFGGKTDWDSLQLLLGPLGYAATDVEAAIPVYAEAIGRHLAAIIDRYPVEAAPGGLALVDSLRGRSDILIGLLTGNVETAAHIKLRAVGYDLADFRVGAYGSEAPDRSGLPPIALRRAEALHGGPFRRVVIIGDTPDDVICARTIGACCLAVTSGYGKQAEIEAEQPCGLFNDLGDTDAVVAAILGP